MIPLHYYALRGPMMKRVLALILILCFLCGCSPGTVSGSPGVPAQASAPESAGAPEGNPNPIPALKDVTDSDVTAVLWRCDGVTDGLYEIWAVEQARAALDALRSVQLLDRISDDATMPALEYELRLKDGSVVRIGFAADWVDVGDSRFRYTDNTCSGYPETVYAVMVENTAYGVSTSYEGDDKEALISALETRPCLEPPALRPEAGDAITFWLTGTGYAYNTWYKAVKTGGHRYIYKRFFGLYVCLGEIGDDGYDALKLAQNGQYGSHLTFSVTSAGKALYPPAVFVGSMTYHIDAGVCADAFPRITDYAAVLETAVLSPDFSVWIRDPDKTWYRLAGPDGFTAAGEHLTASAFDGAPPGTYQAEVYVSMNGDYVEALGQYEYSTDVYYFLVSVP